MKRLLQIIPVFLLSFAAFFHPVAEFSQDLGRHIRLGEVILQTHFVPKINLFSYTYPNFPFINTHWLSEVLFYLLSKHLGLQGLMVTVALLGALAFTFIFYFVLRKNSYTASFLPFVLYLCIVLERTLLRPEIFSFFFLSIFMVILYKWKERNVMLNSFQHPNEIPKQVRDDKSWRWLFLLPIIQLLWVNMHIYFPIGILLVGLFLVDQIFVISRHSREISKHIEISHFVRDDKIKILSIVFVLCCLVTLINPNGLVGAFYPLNVFSNYGYSIQENQSLLFLYNYGMWLPWFTAFTIGSVLLLILALCLHRKTTLIDWLLILLGICTAFSAVRNFPLFVFITFIPFVKLFQEFLSKVRKQFEKKVSFIAPTEILFCLMLSMLFLYLAGTTYGFGFGVKPGAEHALDFFIRNNIKGPIFNNFDMGSYLDYRLYPKERVFVDERPEAYPKDFFQKEYIPMQQGEEVFKKEDKKYHFNSIVFAHTDQTPWAYTFLKTILKNSDWKLIYLDDVVVILVKNIPVNQAVIQKHTLSESDIISQKIVIPTNLNSLFRTIRILEILSWTNAEIALLQRLLSIQSNSCYALGTLTNLLSQRKDPATNIYYTQYQQLCQ